MVKITYQNSFSDITGLTQAQLDHLKKKLSYDNKEVYLQKTFLERKLRYLSKGTKEYNSVKWAIKQLGPVRVCWMSDTGKFPTGLSYLVCEGLEELKVGKVTSEDKREAPEPYLSLRWRNKTPDLRYYQQEMLGIAEDNPRGVFQAAVGSGKSLVITELIKQKDVNTLIIVPSLALLEQLYRTLYLHFGNKVEKLGKAGRKKPITICNIQSLAAANKNGKIDNIIKDLDMIIVDEIHHAGANSYTSLLPKIEHVYYRYGFTGTFLRNDSKTMDMHGFLYKKLYDYMPDQATKEGYLTPVDYNIITIPGTQKWKYQKEYTENYCDNPKLFYSIFKLIEQLPKEDQVLILVERKEKSGAVLSTLFGKHNIEHAYVSGDDDKTYVNDCIEKFNERKVRIMIGSTVIGEGVDVHSTDHLILATGGKSEIRFVQAVGRAVRLHPGKEIANVYDFQFTDTKYLEQHFFDRLEIFKKNFAGNVCRKKI